VIDQLPKEWRERLAPEMGKDYFKKLTRFVNAEYRSHKQIYPAREHLFRAFESIDYSKVKVVILGQDPYHGEGQAVGLSFAVPNDLRLKPPSLQNIFKEIKADLNVEINSKASDLSGWVDQGVLLLNAVLSVRAQEAFSHRNQGWEEFSTRVIEELNKRKKPLVFILWGAPARSKKALITEAQHKVLEAAHPSPLSASRGFFGCKHFSQCNEFLLSHQENPIEWSKTSLSL